MLNIKRQFWRDRHCNEGLDRYYAYARKNKKKLHKFYANKEIKLRYENSVSTFYEYVNSKLSSACSSAPILCNGFLLTDDAEKANVFDSYFASVFTSSNKPLYVIDRSSSDNGIDFSPKVVYEAMCKAKHSYSAGPDGLPSIMWVKLASVLALPVSILFAASYKLAVLPSAWRRACVLPHFKKGNPSVVSNYRPISLTSTLGKVMEMIIKEHHMQFALSHIIISSNQHGFVQNRSTCTQFLECHYDWSSGLD